MCRLTPVCTLLSVAIFTASLIQATRLTGSRNRNSMHKRFLDRGQYLLGCLYLLTTVRLFSSQSIYLRRLLSNARDMQNCAR
jgi:hypothetical protein